MSQVYVRTVVAFTPGSFHGSIRQVCPSWELRANMRGRADWAKRAREDDIRRKVSGLIYIYRSHALRYVMSLEIGDH